MNSFKSRELATEIINGLGITGPYFEKLSGIIDNKLMSFHGVTIIDHDQLLSLAGSSVGYIEEVKRKNLHAILEDIQKMRGFELSEKNVRHGREIRTTLTALFI